MDPIKLFVNDTGLGGPQEITISGPSNECSFCVTSSRGFLALRPRDWEQINALIQSLAALAANEKTA